MTYLMQLIRLLTSRDYMTGDSDGFCL